MSNDSNDFSKIQAKISAGEMPIVFPEHMSPPVRPLAIEHDPDDFSWCALHDHTCARNWCFDARTMFNVATHESGSEKTHEAMVCFSHYVQNKYGLFPIRDRLGYIYWGHPQPHMDDWRVVARACGWKKGNLGADWLWFWRLTREAFHRAWPFERQTRNRRRAQRKKGGVA